jgi:2,3-bisphosphoglycerate-dependent phosphoglycerate mutase
MTKIWLVRHGEAHVNRRRDDGLMHLIDEHGLTDTGVAQARRLRDRLTNDPEVTPDVILSSTFARARETAAIASADLGLPIIDDDTLQEWRPGADAAGLTLEQAMAAWGRVYAGLGHDDRLSPLTETHNEFVARADAALARIADEHAGQQVLIFTHGGVIGRSFVRFLGLPAATALAGVHPSHTSLTEWTRIDEFGAPVWQLSRYNDATHLRDDPLP